MAKIDTFSAPGNLKDFTPALAASWSPKISGFLDREVAGLMANPGLQPQFYNASKLDVSGDPAPISWPGFPQIIELQFGDDPTQMFTQAEKRDNQDEYLEWATVVEGGKITRVMFTCEGPEYWEHLAKDKTLLLKVYSDIVGRQVAASEILSSTDKYLPRNPLNLKHAIHLIQVNNTLTAEINIAAQATIIRKQGATDPIEDANDLINCSGFGQAERHSDPHIGDVVNGVARQGRSITLQDPIGLYIASLPHPTNDLGIKKPGGGTVGMDYWKPQTRGDSNHILRAVFEAPAGQPAVGDLEIGGQKITFGGQVVKAGTGMRVKLTGVIGKAGVFHNHSFVCPGQGPFAIAPPTGFGSGTRSSRRG